VTGAGPRVVAPTFETRCGRTWLTYPDFYPGPGLVHGVAVFRDTSFDSDRRQWLERAKAVVGEAVAREGVVMGGVAKECDEIGLERIVVPWQVHSAKVCDGEALVDGEECDGLITAREGVMVGVTVADCVPLLAVNLKDRVAGAAHCGWRGTAVGIVGEFVDALDARGARGADGDATRYLIGPAIGPCCYEVGEDMLSHFSDRDRETCVIRRAAGAGMGDGIGGINGTGGGSRTFFDLKAAVVARLMDRGVAPEQICVDNTCTSCQQYQLSSYRAGGRDCGRMLAFVMLTRRGSR